MKNFLKQLWSLILPITVLVFIPLSIETRMEISFNLLLILGIPFVIAGLILMIRTISMFIRIGKGTLAPWSPTSKLVSNGVYAHTRNPMITGVLMVLLGEVIIFYSGAILVWFILFFIINYIYFLIFEEPRLVKRFGQEYIQYKRNVPRWIPRLKPWKPEDKP
jgi:protein-S-isoprenylcysteine O-methyltransferase Ste14